jgi:hypothetical protein
VPPLGRERACSAGFSSISPGKPRIEPSSRASRPDEQASNDGQLTLGSKSA